MFEAMLLFMFRGRGFDVDENAHHLLHGLFGFAISQRLSSATTVLRDFKLVTDGSTAAECENMPVKEGGHL